jgi:hypothetical protein
MYHYLVVHHCLKKHLSLKILLEIAPLMGNSERMIVVSCQVSKSLAISWREQVTFR